MMHRHRSPGNGYRFGSVGMGLGASRISPDSSTRGHSFCSSEYKSFNNRGFVRGQGQSKRLHHPPQPLQRKGDILMEAGRLAAEYLVSKGLVAPQSSFSGKWQNGGLKKQVGDYQNFRLQEDVVQEGRTSAHAHLGSAADLGVGRRRYSDDFNSWNHGKGRRSGEYYHRNNRSDWGREYGGNGSWSDRSRVSPHNEEDETSPGNFEERKVADDIGDRMQKSDLCSSVPECGEAAEMESGVEYNNSNEMGSKAITSSCEKDEADKKPSKASDDVTDCNLGNEDGNSDNGADKQIVPKDSNVQCCTVESDLSGKHGSNLLNLCKFAKVPTKIRSALSYRVPKVDRVRNTDGAKASEIGPPKGSNVSAEDGTVEFAAANMLPTNDSKIHDSEISKEVPVQSAYEIRESGSTHGDVQGKCMRSQSFPDGFFVHNSGEELSQGVPSFVWSISVKERGEKRIAEDSAMNDVTKRPREWLPSLIGEGSDHLPLSSLCQNQEGSQEAMVQSKQQVMVDVDEDSLVNSHLFPKPGRDPCAEYPQEKHLYSNSFKICDLNLMETSDVNDDHCNGQILMYASVTAIKSEAAQIDVDLAISNSNLSSEYNRCTSNSKNIEVIDLENDSIEEDKAFDNSQRRENDFSGTGGFPNRAQSAGDISDAQENYDGLISEFLTTFSSSSVTEDITPLQNEIDLHNGEETLGDDDSIYMSLGEIPLSMKYFNSMFALFPFSF